MFKKYILCFVSILFLLCTLSGCGDFLPVNNAHYIGDRYVQYNDKDDIYELMFALYDSNNRFVDASGTAIVKITDIRDNIIYENEIKFSKNDFTFWTVKNNNDSTFGCWLNIPCEDIKGAVSSKGTLSLAVDLDDGTRFGEGKITIYDLPSKKASIILPETPISIVDARFGSYYATVSKVSYDSENDYDGKMTVTLKLTVSLDAKEGDTLLNFMEIGYKFEDREGFVADRGSIYVDDLQVGEKTKVEQVVYDLDPTETYTLTLENPSLVY